MKGTIFVEIPKKSSKGTRSTFIQSDRSLKASKMGDEYRPPPPQSHPVTEFRDPVEYRDRESQSSTTKLIRGIFIVINLVFFAFGLFLIIQGAIDLDYYKVELDFWTEHVDKIFKGVGESYDLAAKLGEFDFNAALHGTMIGIGVAICLLSFIGQALFLNKETGCFIYGNPKRQLVNATGWF